MSSDAVVSLRGATRQFVRGGEVVHALAGVDLDVIGGSFAVVHGRSGSGKTTLLNVIGGLDVADGGSVTVCGLDLRTASTEQRTDLRRDRLAFVFQHFGLLDVLTAAENVEIPMRLAGVPAATRRARVVELLGRVGVDHRAEHRPGELSGGERQRVAIARALAGNPQLLIADEPTGQLDARTGRAVLDALLAACRDDGITAIVATHDGDAIERADVTIALRDGAVAVP